jgi:hypothetical protein
MKKLLVLVGLASLVFAGTAMAQIDPDPDGIGLYFDMDGTSVCGEAGTGMTANIYLAITNASRSAGISGWEAHVVLPDPLPAGHFVLAWTLFGDGLNLFAPPDFVVGLGSPLPWTPAIVVLNIQMGVFGAPTCIPMALRPANQPSHPGYMVYVNAADFTDIVNLQYSAGADYNAPCAMLNCGPDCGVVSDEASSWGSVKSLYR